MTCRHLQRGYLLITVVVALFLLATVAVMLTYGSAISAKTASAELEASRAEYAARAGMQHALWAMEQSACTGEATVPDTTLGDDSYMATITGVATGTAYVLDADQDAWIRSDQPDTNNGNSDNHVRYESGKTEQALTRFDLSPLPANAQISSAIAWFHIKSGKEHAEGSITVYEVRDDWAEATVTWASFDGAYRRSALGVIPAQYAGDAWVAVNLTGLVQGWVNGQPNHGILFDSLAEGLHTEYSSRENGSAPPRLDVVVATAPASAATIRATGTLESSVTRSLERSSLRAYQPAAEFEATPGQGDGKDAMIKQDLFGNNLGANDELSVQDTAGGNGDHSLLQFDLSGVPTGARIDEATLSLHQHYVGTPGGTVGVHRLMKDWDEGNQVNFAGDGATWVTFDFFQFWALAGGDFEAEAWATVSIPGGGVGRHEWDITPLVQGWIRGEYPNQGLILTPESPGTDVSFYSSDYADAELHPRLTVRFACECGSPCMAPQGSGTIALIGDNTSPNPDDQRKIASLESWGYQVDFFEDRDSNTIDWSNYDLAYVSETAVASDVSADLFDAPIAVVNEEPSLYDDLRLASGDTAHVGSDIDIIDNSHFITSVFAQGPLPIYTGDMEILTANAPLAPGLQTLGEFAGRESLTVLEKGTQTIAGTAAGRRVTLPFGQHVAAGFDWANINDNGQLLVQRAIAWAIGSDMVSLGDVLLVVVDDTNLNDQEDAVREILESFGYTVNLIDESSAQAAFDAAFPVNDVVYVHKSVSTANVQAKLVNAPIGMVIGKGSVVDELGIAAGRSEETGNEISITNNGHYITYPFEQNSLSIYTSNEKLTILAPALAPDLEPLATGSGGVALATVDAGASLLGGVTAAGRRVTVPWTGSLADLTALDGNGRTIFRRAIEWAAGANLPGPIAHWKLDETGGTTAVDSAGGNDGTLVNGPTWTSGAKDGGLRFDGSDDRVDAGTLDVNGSGVTMAGWFYADALGTNDPRIVSKANSTAVNGAWWQLSTSRSGSDSFLRMRIKAAGTTTTLGDTTTKLAPGLWYHAAGTYDDASGRMTLYVDGVAIASANHAVGGPIDTDPSVSVEIGANGTAQRYFDGILDDIRIYDRALAASEIAELAYLPPPLPVAHWKLDETSGTTAVDSIGGHDGTLTNGPSWVSGTIDGGLSVDGSNDFVEVVHDDALSLTTFSISSWIRPSALDDWYVVVRKGFGGSNANFFLSTDLDEVRFGFVNSGFVEFKTSGANLTPGNWYHISGTFDDATGEGKVYLDGLLMHSGTTTRSPLPNSDVLTLGRTGPIRFFPGVLDDVRIYDTVLSASEIAALAAAGGGGGGSSGPGSCDGTFRDGFNSASWDGAGGTLAWSGPWAEVGESDGPGTGDVQIRNDLNDSRLRIRDNNNGGEGVERVVDLSGAATATLSFDYRRQSLDNSDDYVAVYASSNGTAGPWTELPGPRIQGGNNDSSYQPWSRDISNYISGNTAIRLRSSPSLGNTDVVYFDNIQIQCTP